MNRLLFEPAAVPTVAIAGSPRLFPVHRIYCVGRNYAEHVREMGKDPARDPPFFFQKPADAIVANGTPVQYPMRTANFHHEIELVVAIGRGGREIPAASALEHVYGYATGNDYTRRDLQVEARNTGRPWDTGKAFDHSAAVGTIHPVEAVGHPAQGRIWLSVNGETRQQADLKDLIWSVPELIAELSTFFELAPGDLIFTGTPAGVSAIKRGDRVEGGIDRLDALFNTIV